jgi:hypothetical protein
MAGVLTAAQAPGADNSFGRAVQAVEARLTEIDKIENTIPGRAIVAVQVGHRPLIDVHGTTRITDGEPVSPATPFYIASMTKAFVGLMAIRLDEAGIMPLGLTLSEVFPDMTVTGVNLRQVTMRRLLSHQVGFTAQALHIPFRVTFYVCAVPGYILLYCLHILLKNIRVGIVFDNQNTKMLRIISWSCIGVGVITFVSGFFYMSFFLVAVASTFFALIIRVIKNVFEQAIEIKSENDFTI